MCPLRTCARATERWLRAGVAGCGAVRVAVGVGETRRGAEAAVTDGRLSE